MLLPSSRPPERGTPGVVLRAARASLRILMLRAARFGQPLPATFYSSARGPLELLLTHISTRLAGR